VRLSAITDEISQDLEIALRVCESLGVETIELRTIDGTQLVEHDAATVRRIGSAIRSGGFGCAVIDTPFLKAAPVGAGVSGAEWATFRRGLELAAELGAGTVRVFSGARPEGLAHGAAAGSDAAPREALAVGHSEPLGAGPRDPLGDAIAGAARKVASFDARWTADVLARAVELAAEAGVRAALEIEWECAVATRDEAADVLAAMPADGLGIVWDPGNEARLTGAATPPDGDAAVRERIVHVHVKDVDDRGEWTRVGSGLVDWRGELRRLAADGYDGLLSLETHYSLLDGGLPAATRESAGALRELAAEEGIAL
jgi:sugar phosphate isomerase/epimerase